MIGGSPFGRAGFSAAEKPAKSLDTVPTLTPSADATRCIAHTNIVLMFAFRLGLTRVKTHKCPPTLGLPSPPSLGKHWVSAARRREQCLRS